MINDSDLIPELGTCINALKAGHSVPTENMWVRGYCTSRDATIMASEGYIKTSNPSGWCKIAEHEEMIVVIRPS